MCENRNGANDPEIKSLRAENTDQSLLSRPFIGTTWCKAVRSSVKQGSVVQESLPGVLDYRTFSRVRLAPDLEQKGHEYSLRNYDGAVTIRIPGGLETSSGWLSQGI